MKQAYICPELHIVLLQYKTALLSDSLTELMSTGLNEEDAIILGGNSDDEVIVR